MLDSLPVVRCCFLLPHFTSGCTMKILWPCPTPVGTCCWKISSTSVSPGMSWSSPAAPLLQLKSSGFMSAHAERENGRNCGGDPLEAACTSPEVAAAFWVKDRCSRGSHGFILLRNTIMMLSPCGHETFSLFGHGTTAQVSPREPAADPLPEKT